jgi:hypothetical protein
MEVFSVRRVTAAIILTRPFDKFLSVNDVAAAFASEQKARQMNKPGLFTPVDDLKYHTYNCT